MKPTLSSPLDACQGLHESPRVAIDAPAFEQGFPAPSQRFYLITVLALAVLLSYGDRLVINLVADGVQSSLGLTNLSMSLVMGSGFAMLYAFCGIPLGRLADTRDRRRLVIAGIALWSLATACSGIATGFGQLFLARMLVGLGEAALMPAATSLIADSFPPGQRGKAFGFFHLGAVLGSGAALGLGGLLLASVERGLLQNVHLLGSLPAWRNVLLLASLPGLPICLLMLFAHEPPRHGRRGVPHLRTLLAASLAQRGRVARTCLSIGVVAAGDYGLLSWLPSVLRQDAAMEPSAVGRAIGIMVALGGLGGCLIGGWGADWFARRRGLSARVHAMQLGYALSLASVPLLVLGGARSQLAGAALWVLGSVSGIVAANAYLPETVANEYRATVIALSNICSALLGLGLGPTLVVLLSWAMPGDATTRLRLGIAALCAIVSLLALLLLTQHGRAAHDNTQSS